MEAVDSVVGSQDVREYLVPLFMCSLTNEELQVDKQDVHIKTEIEECPSSAEAPGPSSFGDADDKKIKVETKSEEVYIGPVLQQQPDQLDLVVPQITMPDSSSFTSLHDLIQSHMSKVSLQASQSGDSINQKPLTRKELTAKVMEKGTLTPAQLLNPPSRQLYTSLLPNASHTESANILAQQVANMLKAKELKRQKEEEEKRLLEEKMDQLRIENYVIDLSPAILDPSSPHPQIVKENKDLEEIIFKPNFFDNDTEQYPIKHPITKDGNDLDETLLCPVDLSYLLKTRIKKKKCSPFGRVLCARHRVQDVPYIGKKFNSNIVRFDFSTPSPDDIAKENAKKVNRNRVDIYAELGIQKSDFLLEREKANGFKSRRGVCLF